MARARSGIVTEAGVVSVLGQRDSVRAADMMDLLQLKLMVETSLAGPMP
jgi:hypothetical protein